MVPEKEEREDAWMKVVTSTEESKRMMAGGCSESMVSYVMSLMLSVSGAPLRWRVTAELGEAEEHPWKCAFERLREAPAATMGDRTAPEPESLVMEWKRHLHSVLWRVREERSTRRRGEEWSLMFEKRTSERVSPPSLTLISDESRAAVLESLDQVKWMRERERVMVEVLMMRRGESEGETFLMVDGCAFVRAAPVMVRVCEGVDVAESAVCVEAEREMVVSRSDVFDTSTACATVKHCRSSHPHVDRSAPVVFTLTTVSLSSSFCPYTK